MNKKDKAFVEGQLILSKKQSKDKRYDYLCSQFNVVEYAMKLEKYTIELQKELKSKSNKFNKIRNHIESKHGWEIAHHSPSNINIPYETLCEELLEMLGVISE